MDRNLLIGSKDPHIHFKLEEVCFMAQNLSHLGKSASGVRRVPKLPRFDIQHKILPLLKEEYSIMGLSLC